jgi:hypothetical protein
MRERARLEAETMAKLNDVEREPSGLLIGSEPLAGVRDRRASASADDDKADGDTADDDATDTDGDSDGTDGDSSDTDGKD